VEEELIEVKLALEDWWQILDVLEPMADVPAPSTHPDPKRREIEECIRDVAVGYRSIIDQIKAQLP